MNGEPRKLGIRKHCTKPTRLGETRLTKKEAEELIHSKIMGKPISIFHHQEQLYVEFKSFRSIYDLKNGGCVNYF